MISGPDVCMCLDHVGSYIIYVPLRWRSTLVEIECHFPEHRFCNYSELITSILSVNKVILVVKWCSLRIYMSSLYNKRIINI